MRSLNWLALLALFAACSVCAEERGLVLVRDQAGKQVGLYRQSHALLVGVSDYTAGWPDLESVPSEIEQIQRVLRAQGFSTEKVSNPNAGQLWDAFKAFIDRYGFDPNNRLLFYFAGHGYTRQGTKGYLVPADAPDPRQDERGFLRKSLDMAQIIAWTRRIEAKHALFLFDSCFSGTVFQQRALADRPPHITALTSAPVRQFITAGSAGETVPAKSVFAQVFVDAIEHRLADLDKDGFVTGTELGVHLQAKVPNHARQTPQFGKHPDYDLSRGDFVFEVGASRIPPKTRNSAWLTVRSNVHDDTLYIDGEARGSTGATAHEVAAGSHVVRVFKKGYVAYEVTVDVAAGDEKVIQALLRADREPALATSRNTFRDCPGCPLMMRVPSGSYSMGDTRGTGDRSERPVTRMKISSFAIGVYEVTFAQWEACVSAGGCPHQPSNNGWGSGKRPVMNVSWRDARTYVQWLSQKTGQAYRLPSEAEWEYAARAGSESEYWWGDTASHANANYGRELSFAGLAVGADRWEHTSPVGSFNPNKFGIYDVAGNVWEWVDDCWHDSYAGRPNDGRSWEQGCDEGSPRVVRGGSWSIGPDRLRSAFRYSFKPYERNTRVGFRVARSL